VGRARGQNLTISLLCDYALFCARREEASVAARAFCLERRVFEVSTTVIASPSAGDQLGSSSSPPAWAARHHASPAGGLCRQKTVIGPPCFSCMSWQNQSLQRGKQLLTCLCASLPPTPSPSPPLLIVILPALCAVSQAVLLSPSPVASTPRLHPFRPSTLFAALFHARRSPTQPVLTRRAAACESRVNRYRARVEPASFSDTHCASDTRLPARPPSIFQHTAAPAPAAPAPAHVCRACSRPAPTARPRRHCVPRGHKDSGQANIIGVSSAQSPHHCRAPRPRPFQRAYPFVIS
jgi:hypothetical protein